ncbi:MAG: hypothetical protein ACJ74Y_09595 [Bryobacteraceae bacterium]
MKIRVLMLLSIGAAVTFAQEGPQMDNPIHFNPVTLASQFFEHNNYFNYFGTFTGVYDSYAPTYNSLGQPVNHGSFGYSIGGGLSGYHAFRRATLSLSYSGNYRNYNNPLFSNGTDQNFAIAYTRRLSRRWTMGLSGNAGTVLYGSGYLGTASEGADAVATNPFSANTRYASAGFSLAYQQTRRWSYVVSGNFFLQRYSYANAIGATGGSGNVGVNYRVTARTTVSVDYGASGFTYQYGSGDSRLNSISGSVSHMFPHNWFVSFNGGITRSNISGFISIPVSALTGNVGAGGYVVGQYSTSSNFPAFGGSVIRNFRRFQISASGGQSIISGNGYYLASRNQYLNGTYSKSFRRSNFSLGGNWYRLKSAANTVAYSYSAGGLGASYSYQLMRYLGSNFRYDYVRYGNLVPYPAITDHRLSFGLTLSSRSVPLTLY